MVLKPTRPDMNLFLDITREKHEYFSRKHVLPPSSDHDQFVFIFSEFKGVMDRKIVYIATLTFLVAQRSVIPLDKCNFPPC